VISYKMARRSFLRGCGGSAALLLPLLRSIEARAQGVAAPLRFLVIHHPLGAAPGLSTWRPGATATTTSFVLPAESAAFAPLQSKMVMIDGLNIITASKAAGNNGGANTHEGGMVALMTGVPALGQIGQQDHCAGGPSMDQLLLARSPLLGGPATPSTGKPTMFGSLQLAADIRSDRDEIAPRVLSYLPPTANADINLARQPLYAETQPLTTFNRIFGGALPMGTNTGALLANRLSILDFMRSDLTRMRTLVPASEKPKLDTHAAAIQQLEASIRATLGPVTTGGTCVKPPAPLNFTQSGSGASGGSAPAGGTKLSGVDYYLPNDPTNHPHQALGQAHLSLIRASFACDLARVATFMWSSGTNWVVFPGTFNGATIKGAFQSTPHHPPSHSDPTGDTATRDWLNQINIFYSQQTAQALQAFDSFTDIDGNTLLDNTIVVYVTEVARAWDHNQMGVPLIVFGGKNTRLRGGTFIKVTGGSLPVQTGVSSSGGTGNRPINDFWLALAPIFGVTNLTSLGNASQFTGPLPGIFT
jgi:Protein of unknown function (DUF1552)